MGFMVGNPGELLCGIILFEYSSCINPAGLGNIDSLCLMGAPTYCVILLLAVTMGRAEPGWYSFSDW
jgi:hypothetical protein